LAGTDRIPGRPQREDGDDRRQQAERAGPARYRAQAVHQVLPVDRNRRASGCTATPAENDSAVIRPAKPADKDRALVTSSGSTTMASAPAASAPP